MTGDGDFRSLDGFEFIEQFFSVHAQTIRQKSRGFLFILDRIGTGKHRVRSIVFRKNYAVSVRYESALGYHGNFSHPLVERAVAELSAPNDLNIEESSRQKAKKKGYRHKYGK